MEYPLNQMDHDSRFLAHLLTIVFDTETLKRSSALGRKPTNSNIVHDALDAELLQFVRGMSVLAPTTDRKNTYVANRLVHIAFFQMFIYIGLARTDHVAIVS